MRVIIFIPNWHPATHLLRELGRSLRQFDCGCHFTNPDYIIQTERFRYDGAIALEGVNFDKITQYRSERSVLSDPNNPGRHFTIAEAVVEPNYAGPDDTIIVSYHKADADGGERLCIGDRCWNEEGIVHGDMGRFLLLERPNHPPKPEKRAPEVAPIEGDLSGMPPPPAARILPPLPAAYATDPGPTPVKMMQPVPGKKAK